MMYVRFPLSLRQVEDLLSERGIDICHETVRYWWNRFGPLFAAEIRRRRVHRHWYSNWRWHLDEVFVRINGKTGIVTLTAWLRHGRCFSVSGCARYPTVVTAFHRSSSSMPSGSIAVSR